jgi:hypothetical protein
MRANLKGRLTTTCLRASRRVKWKITEKDCWFAVAIDEESQRWEPYGIIHRQIGTDGRGHLVWPDQSIHKRNPNYIAFYAVPTDSIELAEQARAALLANKREFDASYEKWTPFAGLQRGRVVPFVPVPTDHVNKVEIQE